MIRKRLVIPVILALVSSVLSTNFAHADEPLVGLHACGDGATFEVVDEGGEIYVKSNSGEQCSGAVVIPEGVTRIGFKAFFVANQITSVVFPDSLTQISGHAFEGNSDLVSVTFGNALDSIQSGAFDGASKLTSLVFPDTLTYIGFEAFRATTKLTTVNFGTSLVTISDSAFAGSDLRNIVIPGTISTIGNEAFTGNPNLATVRINQPDWSSSNRPELEIGSNVFLAADWDAPTNLTTLWLPSDLVGWGSNVLPPKNSETKLTHVYYCGPYDSDETSIGRLIFEEDEYVTECLADLSIKPTNTFTAAPGGLHTIANSGDAGSKYNASTMLTSISGCDSHKYFDLSNPIDGDGNLVNPDGIKSLTFSTGVPVTREMTWSMWINTSDQRGEGEGFTDGIPILGADIPGADNDYAISLNHGKIYWGLGSLSQELDFSIGNSVEDALVNDGKWHHIAVTRNFYTSNLEIYIDAVRKETGTAAVDGIDPNPFSGVYQNASYYLEEGQTDNFSIGQWRSDIGPGKMVFNGKIGTVEAFAQVLDENQILAKYNTEKSNYVENYQCGDTKKKDDGSAAAAAAAAQKQRELSELLSIIPSIAGLALNLGDLTNTLLLKQKCVKGKKTKTVRYGAKCPKGYKKKK